MMAVTVEDASSQGGGRWAHHTARETASQILYGAIELNTRFPEHPGCLNLNGALAGSAESEPLRQIQIQIQVASRSAGQEQIKERIKRARAESDLPASVDPAALAGFITALIRGFAVQAKVGFSRDTLSSMAEQAMAGWLS